MEIDGLATDKILIVDDSPKVRTFCRLALEIAGYSTLEANSAESALQIWEGNRSQVTLVLTDFEMPGSTGTELVGRLQEQTPGLRCLVMSGSLEAAGRLPKSVPFLSKPFAPNDLRDAVRQCLGF